MTFQQAAWNYKKNAILTASPEKLVVLLYEGAIQSLEKARQELRSGKNVHSPSVGEALGKALAIIGELRASLDLEKGGDVARDLNRLYEFASDQILRANMERRPEPVEHTLTILRTLKEGWDGIVARSA